MSGPRSPTVQDFDHFFRQRLSRLPPEQEWVWLSNHVPVEALAASYPLGIFPWPGEEPDFFPWVTPLERGVLFLENFRMGRSTRRQLKQAGYHVTFDRDFPRVIEACHTAHGPQSWIHPRMREAYIRAHRQGFAHSVEVWKDDELAGGLYGIDSGGFFSGESMFHHLPNAGKAAIAALVERLSDRGDSFLDIQQLTPHLQAMGAESLSRDDFEIHRRRAILF